MFLKRLGYDLKTVAEKVAGIYEIGADDVLRRGRQKPRAEERGLFCYWTVRELKTPLTDLARKLDMTVSGVCYGVQRGETIAHRHNYELLE